MRFFLEVDISSTGERWQLYNGDRRKVTEITNPNDPSIGRLIQAVEKLEEKLKEEAVTETEDEAGQNGNESRSAWFLFTVPSLS